MFWKLPGRNSVWLQHWMWWGGKKKRLELSTGQTVNAICAYSRNLILFCGQGVTTKGLYADNQITFVFRKL